MTLSQADPHIGTNFRSDITKRIKTDTAEVMNDTWIRVFESFRETGNEYSNRSSKLPLQIILAIRYYFRQRHTGTLQFGEKGIIFENDKGRISGAPIFPRKEINFNSIYPTEHNSVLLSALSGESGIQQAIGISIGGPTGDKLSSVIVRYCHEVVKWIKQYSSPAFIMDVFCTCFGESVEISLRWPSHWPQYSKAWFISLPLLTVYVDDS